MVTKRWTVEQQMIDREQWARDAGRLEERAKAEIEKQKLQIETIKNLLENGVSIEVISASLNMLVNEVTELLAGVKDK